MLILHQCHLIKEHVGQDLAYLAGVPKWRGRGNLGTQSATGVQGRGSSFFPPPCVPGFAFSLPRMSASLIDSLALVLAPRAVIKSRGVGISPSYYEHGALLLSLENRRKIEPKEVRSCLIPCYLLYLPCYWQPCQTPVNLSIYSRPHCDSLMFINCGFVYRWNDWQVDPHI